MLRRSFIVSIVLLISVLFSFERQPDLGRGRSLQLTSYIDPRNDISISLKLSHNLDNTFALEATFSPPAGYHLYSKDLPLSGGNGQGRPTLLELSPGSRMRSLGPLKESVASDMVNYEPDGPLVYPEGPVTLTLPVSLPRENGWVNDQVSLTYTACSAISCKDPTIGKVIPITVPGALAFLP